MAAVSRKIIKKEQMLGRGRSNRGGRFTGKQQLRFGSEKCICPKCGYQEPHHRGVPCRDRVCPVCNAVLSRNAAQEPVSQEIKNPVKNKAVEFPKVNPEICIGCGNCIAVCPRDAISLVDGVAVIDQSICRNCRVCVKECPVHAIS